MKLVQAFVGSPFAAAVGWAVLHSLWQGAIAAAGLGFVRAAVRSPRIRYAAACLALMLVLAGFTATAVRMAPRHENTATPIRLTAPGLRAAVASNAPAAPIPFLAQTAPWLAPFWMAGVWIACVRQAVGWIALRRMRRRGVCCAPERWQRAIRRLSAKLRVSRPVLLLESCLADAPATFGYFRPVILVPLGILSGLAPEQVEAVLLHELAHIKRSDYVVNAVQKLVEAFLFYNPAVWWLSAVVRTERENCCDDLVIEAGADSRKYACALAELEEHRAARRLPALAASGGNIVKRMRRLLYPGLKENAWPPVFAALTLTVAVVLGLFAFQTRAAAQNPGAAPLAGAASWMKWLNEDVAYIISDAERAAFLALTTDAEREKFIEQFWARRDPTPGTPQNEFKEEHYRRIAYADRHFGTAFGMPGWQTDRGRIYIVYGPPDEIEAHPAGTQRAYATQVWMYHWVEGVGDNVSVTFIDRGGSNDFRLAPGNGR